MNWVRDIRLAIRRTLRAPTFAAATIGTLTVGLGMLAVVYAVVYKVLLEPMPYSNPDDLYLVWRDYGRIAERPRGGLEGTDVIELQKAGGVIENVVALQPFLGGVFSLREGDEPIEISVTVTSPGLFELLGVTPALGRGFAADDAGPGRPLVMVLTHELWNRLGADRLILGKDVRLNGRPHTVIGILPSSFTFGRHNSDGPPQRPDAYTTLRVNLTDPSPNLTDYSVLIRARPGTSPEVVAASVAAVGRVVDARDFGGRGLTFYPVGLKADLVAKVRPALLVVGASGGVLAVMLMVNLGLLLLARAAQREHEFVVSRALGADAGGVTRGLLIEGGLLGLMGGGLGVLTAIWGTRVLVALAPVDLPRREFIAMDWRIAAFVIASGGLLGVVAALAPALWVGRSASPTLLAGSVVRGGGDHGRMRRGMIVAQLGLSLVLLNSAALVVRSLGELFRADPGFNADGALTMLVRTPPVFFPKMSDVLAFQDRVHSELARLPGVSAASAATALPLTENTTFSQASVTIPGAPGITGDAGHDVVLADVIATRAGYTEVMGMRLVEGRTFENARPAGVREALIDSTLARRYFPNGNSVGAKIPFGYNQLTVVGVVEQARLYDVYRDGRPQIYLRAEDWGYRPLFYVVRSRQDPRALVREVQAVVRSVDSRVALGDARTMNDIVDDALRPQLTSAALVGAFALGAVLLAGMGLYGVVAASVTRRRHELAVRLALGADHHRLLFLVLREAAVLLVVGVLIGMPGIYAASRVIRGVLVGVSASDPLTLCGVTLGLTLVTLATCYLPARRLLKLDPAQLFRGQI